MMDIKEQLKKLEVFASGRSVYTWEAVTAGDLPRVIVVSKTDLLLWGHGILQALVGSQTADRVEKLTGVDTVVAEWMNGVIEMITDDNTKFFTSRGEWQEYWNSLDEWPREIDAEAAEGGAGKMTDQGKQEIRTRLIELGVWGEHEIGDPLTSKEDALVVQARLQEWLAPGVLLASHGYVGSGLARHIDIVGGEFSYLIANGDNFPEAICLAALALPEFLRRHPECAT